MENIIIILILTGLIFLGIKESLKHFKGEGGCCGGGSVSKPKKRNYRERKLQKRSFILKGCIVKIVKTV